MRGLQQWYMADSPFPVRCWWPFCVHCIFVVFFCWLQRSWKKWYGQIHWMIWYMVRWTIGGLTPQLVWNHPSPTDGHVNPPFRASFFFGKQNGWPSAIPAVFSKPCCLMLCVSAWFCGISGWGYCGSDTLGLSDAIHLPAEMSEMWANFQGKLLLFSVARRLRYVKFTEKCLRSPLVSANYNPTWTDGILMEIAKPKKSGKNKSSQLRVFDYQEFPCVFCSSSWVSLLVATKTPWNFSGCFVQPAMFKATEKVGRHRVIRTSSLWSKLHLGHKEVTQDVDFHTMGTSKVHYVHYYCWWVPEILRSPVEVGSLSYYLQGFIHFRWCRISAINSSWWFQPYCCKICSSKRKVHFRK